MCFVNCHVCVTARTVSHEPQRTIELYYLYFLICVSLLGKCGIINDDGYDDDDNDSDDDYEAIKQ